MFLDYITISYTEPQDGYRIEFFWGDTTYQPSVCMYVCVLCTHIYMYIGHCVALLLQCSVVKKHHWRILPGNWIVNTRRHAICDGSSLISYRSNLVHLINIHKLHVFQYVFFHEELLMQGAFWLMPSLIEGGWESFSHLNLSNKWSGKQEPGTLLNGCSISTIIWEVYTGFCKLDFYFYGTSFLRTFNNETIATDFF